MTKTFTHDDLIRYVYNETTNEENHEIKEAIACDAVLMEQYGELRKLKAQLDGSMKTPSEKTINNILEYSKASNLHPVKD
ncbi:MAG: hypothetical protein ACJAT1_000352 [Marivirga sp.]|jgi:hypothetical protein